MRQVPNIAGVLLLAFFAAFPLVYQGANYDYVMHVLITAFFYAILASSWSMLAGYAGQFSFGHMAFMGIGAYGTALFCHYFYITAEPTGICTEYPFFGSYFVIVNAIGVTSTTLDQDCLRQAMEIWDGSVKVTPMPVLLGIILGTIAGGLAGLLVGLLVVR
jgi:branched-chain amino acid transport system permease protein